MYFLVDMGHPRPATLRQSHFARRITKTAQMRSTTAKHHGWRNTGKTTNICRWSISGFVVCKSHQALRGVEKAGHHGPCAQGAEHPHNHPMAAVCLITSLRSPICQSDRAPAALGRPLYEMSWIAKRVFRRIPCLQHRSLAGKMRAGFHGARGQCP